MDTFVGAGTSASQPPSAPFFQSHEHIYMQQQQQQSTSEFHQPRLQQQQQQRNQGMPTAPPLSEDQVLESLESYVQGNCCYRDGFIKEMKLKEFLATPVYGYALELFIEKRTKDWVTEPYRGEYLPQEYQTGVPVDMWAVPIPPPLRFGSSTQTHTVPGSTSVVNW